VHCHQTGSTLALEFVFFAKVLGVRVVLTEHSLYGFRRVADICFNRVSRLFLGLCDHVIAVSKTTRNNIILRGEVERGRVTVIPNGVSDVSHVKRRIEARKGSD
jgi:phosphatidylinositol glycan class A protein